jgi:hypothetical protein
LAVPNGLPVILPVILLFGAAGGLGTWLQAFSGKRLIVESKAVTILKATREDSPHLTKERTTGSPQSGLSALRLAFRQLR